MAERILEAANTLLANRGYSAFSYADIEEMVKIRKASIHYHFPTKSGLVVALLKRHRSKILEAMTALDTHVEDPLLRIRNYFKYWEGCIADGSLSFCIAALLGAVTPSLPLDVQAEVHLHFAMLTDWFGQTLNAGLEVRAIELQQSVAVEAQMLIAVLHGGMLSARATSDADVFRSLSWAALHRICPRQP